MAKKLDPDHQVLADQVVTLQREWTGPGPRPPHAVAHKDPDTGLLTFHIRGLPEQLDHILAALRKP